MMTQNYKYSLDPSSRKFICPNCRKKTFVKFIKNDTQQYLNDIDGRCDRESKCGYFKKPAKNCITNNSNATINVLQPSYHSAKILHHYSKTKQQNHFITYLLQYFDEKDVIRAINRYHIGTTNYWSGAIVFWQIDVKNLIHGGKIMLYNCDTGKRIKEPFNHVSWVHKQLKLPNFVLQQCLFGLHNLNNIKKGDIVCVVESEKTAIIMSMVVPEYIWLATGSKTGFKREMLQPIKNYKIIAYPDKTEYQKWNKISVQLHNQGFNIQCSNLLEKIDIEDGGDLVDYLQK
jgi:hypothetical protein